MLLSVVDWCWVGFAWVLLCLFVVFVLLCLFVGCISLFFICCNLMRGWGGCELVLWRFGCWCCVVGFVGLGVAG